MCLKHLNLGIALSGGEVRAILFHSGVLKFLAERKLLEQVKVISSVSGGSIFVSLLYTFNNNKWPTSEEYLKNVYPKFKYIICNKSISKFWTEHLLNPFYWSYLLKRDAILATALEKQWGIKGMIGHLPDSPKWFINAAIAKNGEKWLFSQKFMGGEEIGYVDRPKISIANAVAASAAYPGIVGPFQLKTSDYTWYEKNPETCDDCSNRVIEPENDTYYLYDGGMFDNIGCDSLFKEFGEELTHGVNTVILSNACAPLNTEWFCKWKVWARTMKMFDMVSTHVDDLRLRWIESYIRQNKKKGVLLRVDSIPSEIIPEDKKDLFAGYDFMTKKDIDVVMNVKTHLNKVSEKEYNAVVRNGYETALIKCETFLQLHED